ncbi:MAG: transketolase [Saprospiraceae bacterium]|nr:transketolase [Saprospiraceae bacterium]
MSKTAIQQAADNLRIIAASMVESAKSGHPGGAMGGADFMTILYSEYMVYDPEDMHWAFRDRFYLDPGHMSAMLYSQLGFLGNYTSEELENFRQWGSPTPGHPEIDIARGIENTSGPLGLGHAFGAGSAVAERFLRTKYGDWAEHMTYIYISDGGIQEEISQGVGRIAGHLGLGNMVMFYDANDIQLSTVVDSVTSEDTAKKYEAWGWHVITIDGNNHDEIRKALDASLEENTKPSLIIGKTTMGLGAITSEGISHEGKVNTHGQPLSKTEADIQATITNLGGDPSQPFAVFPAVQEHYENVLEEKRELSARRKAKHHEWATSNPDLDAKLSKDLTGERPELDWASLEQKQGVATRASSGSVLSWLADQTDNMIVSSADLCNSDKTEAFLKKSSELTSSDFSGNFFQAGVSELTMAAMSIGIGLHGGLIPVCATFFAFSDYMKPAIRVAALMETPVIFMWTHDSFRVGEDGPTHQPIEQEAQLRLLEKVQNHSHKNSLLALRPADASETTVAWQMAFENTETPTGLIFTRQNVPALPGNTYVSSLDSKQGAYVVNEDEHFEIILLGSGSEVSTLAGAADILREKKYRIRVVSVPSEGLFRKQSSDYQQSVLPSGVKKFGLTAGLSVNLEGLVGGDGIVHGVNHFGYSAPAKVLDEKFGFTPESAAANIEAFINQK